MSDPRLLLRKTYQEEQTYKKQEYCPECASYLIGFNEETQIHYCNYCHHIWRDYCFECGSKKVMNNSYGTYCHICKEYVVVNNKYTT